MTPGEKLRNLRGTKSKAEIAKEIGVSESSYIKYERNERVPSDEVKKKLANCLNASVSFIFFE